MTKEQGMVIAERIREKVAGHAFRLSADTNVEKLHVTVSIGASAFPEDAHTKEELIAKSDKAMYIAKFSGKNRTCS